MDDFGLYGGVANGAQADQYLDAWVIDFGAAYFGAVFNWSPNTTNFDGFLSVVTPTVAALYTYTTADTATGGAIDLGILTGEVTFVLNPISGAFKPREEATWDLQVASVPLPTCLPLLALGLGCLALIRRRRH